MKFNFLLHLTSSGAYTALSLASLSLATNIVIFNSKPDWQYFIFLFFATFLYYNFHKISWFGHPRMIKFNTIKYQWPAQYPGLLLLSLIIGFAGTMALITESIITPMQLLFGTIAGTIALLYNQKIIGIHLRSIKGVKAFSIASVSIIAAVFIPAAKFPIAEVNLLLTALYALAQFLFISALCIASDLRDIDEDKEDQIKTFPVAAGAAISKKIISILMGIHILLLFIIYNLNFMNLHQLEGYLMVSMLTLLFIANLNPSKGYYYFILGVDGLILCQSISILICN